MADLLNGAVVMACAVIGGMFLRFWAKSLDRLFAYFAAAFWLFGLNHLILALTDRGAEFRPYIYLIRLAAFVLIIIAIVEKNRTEASTSRQRRV